MSMSTSNIKPASSRKTQFLLAASMWLIVGCLLLGFGLKWLIGSHSNWMILLLLGAMIVGGVKGHFILHKSALRTINRIQKRGDGTCVFGVFPIWQWLLVGVMMTGGGLLRTSGLPDEFLGAIYVSIGAALIMGSIFTWRAYFNS
tara:strand:- start:1383 stop:1817 length:435 start_codon:yes stop_codon:yes gene_type:complete